MPSDFSIDATPSTIFFEAVFAEELHESCAVRHIAAVVALPSEWNVPARCILGSGRSDDANGCGWVVRMPIPQALRARRLSSAKGAIIAI